MNRLVVKPKNYSRPSGGTVSFIPARPAGLCDLWQGPRKAAPRASPGTLRALIGARHLVFFEDGFPDVHAEPLISTGTRISSCRVGTSVRST